MPGKSLCFYNTAHHNHYIYDSNSNKIFEVDKKLWESLQEGELPPPDYSAKGFLEHHGNRTFVRLSTDEFTAAIESNIEKLTIEITQECNLNCAYCPYNENFFSFQDRSSPLSISSRKALEAVRFFFDHSRDNNYKGISFYGGEPLLRWNIIADAVEFARGKADPSHQLLFGVTTNGVLLKNDTISKFLAHHGFAIHVSLDGPPQIHDRFRRNHADDATFSTILKGLGTLRRRYKEDFYRKVHFNAVVTPLSDLEEMRDFFRQFEFIRTADQLRVNVVTLGGAKPELIDMFSDPTTQTRFNRQLADLRNHYLSCVANGTEPERLEKALFDRQFRILSSRYVDEAEVPRNQPIPAPDICFPLQKKLFVDVHGKFFICEKLNNFEHFGDLDRGIDTKKLYQFYESHIEEFIAPHCASCWAKRFCSFCYVPAFQNGKSSIKSRKTRCEQIKKRLKQDLADYTEVLEKNPHGFDFFLRQAEETVEEETT